MSASGEGADGKEEAEDEEAGEGKSRGDDEDDGKVTMARRRAVRGTGAPGVIITGFKYWEG